MRHHETPLTLLGVCYCLVQHWHASTAPRNRQGTLENFHYACQGLSDALLVAEKI